MYGRSLATVDSLEVAAYRIPTDQPESDGTLAWDSTTMVVVHARAGDVRGVGYTYATEACIPIITGVLAPAVTGRSALDTPGAWLAMVNEIRNIGRPGVASCAISAVDTALWDLKARLLDVPLADLFGRMRPGAPIYGSGGFITYDEPTARHQLEHWTRDWSISSVKIKIGEDAGTDVARDARRIAFAREVIGPDVDLFVDANGGYTAKQAIRVGRVLDDCRVTWFEEPVSSDDLDGLRAVRNRVSADVTAGEYGFDLAYFGRMVAADAVDCLQIDATRCGGYSEWLRAAAVAAAHGLEVSAHCAPNLHLPVAAATPNLRHIEYFHDHVRIEDALFDGAGDPNGGILTPSDPTAPGNGLTFKAADAESLRIG